MNMLKQLAKKILSEEVILIYHKMLARLAAFWFGYPSKKMLVVAVTGTKGKTSTLNFLWHVLSAGGYKVGLISTANIKIGEREIKNWYHMTMPGPFILQKFLREMARENCDVALVEATSEGIKMSRHLGLYYDVAVFTNLTPEHLKSHNNSFQKYKETKGILFANLHTLPKKTWKGKPLEKIIIANSDSEHAPYYLGFPADKKFTFGQNGGTHQFRVLEENPFGAKFAVGEKIFHLALPGVFNVYNAMPAVILGEYLSVPQEKIKEGLERCLVIPGRMEKIDQGQNFTCIVDYAHEAVSMRNALLAVTPLKKQESNKIIVVFGGDGGGREPRTEMVRVISQMADVGIITLSDPFDTDPQIINDFLMARAIEFGMKKGENIFETTDRRKAIRMAIEMAKEGDVILFACKGAEQSIVFKDRIEPWDDREEVRQALREVI